MTANDTAASRAVAEGARQQKWNQRSFMKELFGGRFSLELIHPHPRQDPDEARRAASFLERLEAFAREHIDGDAVDRDGWVPDSVLEGLAELGAYGIKIPREYGGLGLSQISYNRALAIVARRCASTAAFLSAHQSIGVPTPLVLFGTEAQKREYLPRLAGGELSAFALTEPDVGSDPANMATFAEPAADGEHYILNGEKLWTTNGPRADLLVVMARTPPREGVRGRRPISAFVVETGWEGVEVSQVCRFMGLNGISNGVLRFRDVKVPARNLLWGEGRGLKLALITLNTGRLALPAFCTAAGREYLRVSRSWAAERVQWGMPVGRHDAVAQMLGRMAAETYAMDAVIGLAAALSAQGRVDLRLEAAMAKLWHSEKSWDLVNDAVQIRGGRGYERADSLRERGEDAAPLERCLRDSRINLIFEGTSEIMRLFMAREAVDDHLAAAGDVIDSRLPPGRRAAALARAGLHYALWYPGRWIGWGRWPRYRAFGPLAGHLRFAERASRRLARAIFHAMVRFGPGLERRQALLGRLVDIGADLFVIAAVCVRAHEQTRGGVTGSAGARGANGSAASGAPGGSAGSGGSDGSGVREDVDAASVLELADGACVLARRRIRDNFRSVRANDDAAMHALARRTLEARYRWLEEEVGL